MGDGPLFCKHPCDVGGRLPPCCSCEAPGRLPTEVVRLPVTFPFDEAAGPLGGEEIAGDGERSAGATSIVLAETTACAAVTAAAAAQTPSAALACAEAAAAVAAAAETAVAAET